MAQNLRTENVNGYQVAVCENNDGMTFYLYEEDVTLKNGERKHIWFWNSSSPGNRQRNETPCPSMPSGFKLTETARQGQPVLVKS